MATPPGDSHDVAGGCEGLISPGYTNLAVSILLLIGILVSYLPQHYRIISRRSSEGISPYFVLLGTTSGTAAFANILILSREELRCCRTITGFECFAGSLGVAQVGMQWTCFAVILVLFVIFFPRDAPPDIRRANYNTTPSPSFKTALGVAVICVLHAIATGAVSIYFLNFRPSRLIWWANLLGIIATILASIQYFPQLWTTFRLKHVGSLSIPMMLLQTPGSFVWAASLFARLGIDGWSAWGIYMVTGCLQGTLLGMAIHYEIEERKKLKGRLDEHADINSARSGVEGSEEVEGENSEIHPEARPSGEATERTPLLGT
ncbi:hypothetical protein GP486_000002 [Trichoglossum hirsutum]|uniref:PQ loop repeat protein n=1 Tax=Trichoglossum hirsutum TaxID=265104 RepID=A0A9P8LJ97_9PEZI|nr:hypothetical protein GP486_000002 [Trichoglossum hirsutum]